MNGKNRQGARKTRWITVWQVAFTYIGAIVGAGFVSGQEILRFFVIFGKPGLWGAVLSGLLFGLFGLLVLNMAGQGKMTGYHDLLHDLFGEKFVVFFDGVIACFLFLTLAVMLVASSSMFQQLWGISLGMGYFLSITVVFLALLTDLKGVVWLNALLLPGLVILTLFIALLCLRGPEWVFGLGTQLCSASVVHWGVAANFMGNHPVVAFGTDAAAGTAVNFVGGSWLWAVCLYVSYNFVLGAVILSSLGHTAGRGGRTGVALGGVTLGLMAALICFALLRHGGGQIAEAMPMLVLAERIHPCLGRIYSAALWVAIITTALLVGFGLLKRAEKLCGWGRPLCLLFIFLPTVPFLYWSFPQMVALIYPVMGYVGLAFLAAILRKSFKGGFAGGLFGSRNRRTY